ncbi:hypothetical protein XBKQ1_290001 [Xenorhabdus bovienii str. kraussei Quebec]|uniref:Uncharacterized protein n=1 Tax=Xenorhabdus bovienii str. kraussei Quebec TaxID=1398203 RepID=A0A077P9B2_XENBV|nr:hypothetical protein XBKQ1_290001 [Xenorhabdus bovienii str. kraussei Quebec]
MQTGCVHIVTIDLLSKLSHHTPLTYTIRVLLSLYTYTNGVLKHDIH